MIKHLKIIFIKLILFISILIFFIPIFFISMLILGIYLMIMIIYWLITENFTSSKELKKKIHLELTEINEDLTEIIE